MNSKRDASAFLLMQNIYGREGEIVVEDNWSYDMVASIAEEKNELDESTLDRSEAHVDLSQSPEANTRLSELNQQLDKTESSVGTVLQTINLLRTRVEEEQAQKAEKQERKKRRRHPDSAGTKPLPSPRSALEDIISRHKRSLNAGGSSNATPTNPQLDMELALSNFDSEMLRDISYEESFRSPSSSYNPVSIVRVLGPSVSNKPSDETEQAIHEILHGMSNSVKEISEYNYTINKDYEREIGQLISKEKQEKKEKRKKLRRHHQQLPSESQGKADESVSIATSCSGRRGSGAPDSATEPTIEQIYTPSFQRIVADANLKRKRIATAKNGRANYDLLRNACGGSADSVSHCGTTSKRKHKAAARPAASERKAKSVGPYVTQLQQLQQQHDVRAKASAVTTERPRKKRISKFNVSKVSLGRTREGGKATTTTGTEMWPSEQLVELYHNEAAQSENFTSEEALRAYGGGSCKARSQHQRRKLAGTRVERVFEKTYREPTIAQGSTYGTAKLDNKDELIKSQKVKERTFVEAKAEKAKEKTYILKNEEERNSILPIRAKLDKVLDSTYGMTKSEKASGRNVKAVKETASVGNKPVASKPEGGDKGKAQPAKTYASAPPQKGTNREAPPGKNAEQRNYPVEERNGDEQNGEWSEQAPGGDKSGGRPVDEGAEPNGGNVSYQQPTMSSRLKKVDKSYFDRFNFVNVPFVCGTSISPSHNLGINLQSIFSLMKMKQPGLGMSPTEVAGGLLKESRFTGANNRPLTRLLTRMTSRLPMVGHPHCPAMHPISEMEMADCDDDTASTIMRRQHPSAIGRLGGGFGRAEDAWTVDKDCSDPRHTTAQCTCFPTRKTASIKKVSKQYFETTSGIRRRTSLDEQEQGDMFESLQTRIKGLKKVLLALQEDFQSLNKEYNDMCSKNNGERSRGSKERIGQLEKQLGAKEEEINVVMGLFKEVMSLKGQIKQLGARTASPARLGLQHNALAASPLFSRPDASNPYESTAAVRHTRLLRCMQSFQGQLRH